MKASTVFWIIFLFAVSAIFRMFFLDLIEFKQEEAFTVYELEKFYSHPYLMQVGPISSTKVYNPPLYNYLMIGLSFFSRNPQFLSLMIAFINTLCVPLFYLLVKKYYSNRTALLASFLMALSPMSILYSRKIWNTNLLMPFCLAYFYFLMQVVTKKDKKSYLGLFLTLALASQIHLSGLFLTIATILSLIFLKIKINFKYALIGLILGLIPALPYFYRQFSSNPICIDCQTLIKYQSSNLNFDFGNVLRPFQVANGVYFFDALGQDYNLFLEKFPLIKIINFIFYLEYAIPIFGIYLLIRYKSRHTYLLLILGLVILQLILIRTTSVIYHTRIISPLIILIYALSLESIQKFFKSKKIMLGIFLIFLASNTIFEVSFYKFISDKKIIRGDYGQIFAVTKTFAQNQTKPYKNLPNYQQIKTYAYVFSQFPRFNYQLAVYFAQNNHPKEAILEFKKAILADPADIDSRANLAYIYILTRQFDLAKVQIDYISSQNKQISQDLNNKLKEARGSP